MEDEFLAAYKLARSRYSDQAWYNLRTGEQADALFRALRQIDAQAFSKRLEQRQQRNTGCDGSRSVDTPAFDAGLIEA